MASAETDDFCNCEICCITFGEKETCPRILTCGHTFCHACLQKLISDKRNCATCRKNINFDSVDGIPINFSLKGLTEVIEAKEKLPYNENCEMHSLPNQYKCLNCKEYMCRICITRIHKSCTRANNVSKAMKQIKALKKLKISRWKLTKGTNILKNDFEELKKRHEELEKRHETLNKDIKEVKKEMDIKSKLILSNNKIFDKLISLEQSVNTGNANAEYEKTDAKLKLLFKDKLKFPCVLSKEESIHLSKEDLKNFNLFVTKKDKNVRTEYMKVELMEDCVCLSQWKSNVDDNICMFVELSDFLASRDVVCDTKSFFKKHKDVIQNPKLSADPLKYSTVTKSDDGTLRFECFRNETKDEIPIDFENFLKFFGCSTVIPNKAFLKIENNSGESRGEVIIKAYDINPISLNFLLSASGLSKTSYKEKTFGFRDKSIIRGGYVTKPRCKYAVVDGIKETKLPQRKVKTGSVRGGFLNKSKTDYIEVFDVYKKRANKISKNDIFGEIFQGLEIIELIQKGDIIKECGFVID